MKKGLLLLFVGLFLSSFGFSQVLFENFETQPTVASSPHPAVAIAGWFNIAEAGTRTWQARQYGTPVNRYAQSSAYSNNPATQEPSNIMWLTVAGINMDNYTGEQFSFETVIGNYNGDVLTVWYSTDFNGTEAGILGATWTNITSSFTIPAPASGYSPWTASGVFDASAISGTAYFAFKYTGSGTDSPTTTLEVDNVSLIVTSGLNQVDLLATSVYPNPVQNILNVSEKSNVKVMNIAGQVVFSAENVNSIDMSALQTGMYIVSVQNEQGTKIEKIIKN